MILKFISNIRPIIEGEINGKSAYFLLDTGASIALIDENQIEEYQLQYGELFPGTIISTGGSTSMTYFCQNNIEIANKYIKDFVLINLTQIRNSIKRETGIDILGVISYPQLQQLQLTIDIEKNEIIIN